MEATLIMVPDPRSIIPGRNKPDTFHHGSHVHVQHLLDARQRVGDEFPVQSEPGVVDQHVRGLPVLAAFHE